MKKLLLVSVLAAFIPTISSAQEIPLDKTDVLYENYLVQIYDDQTGGKFPFNVTIVWEVGGCTGSQIKATKVDLDAFNDTYLFKMESITPAIVCQKPNQVKSQTIAFPKGKKGFANLIIPKGVEVKVERSQTPAF